MKKFILYYFIFTFFFLTFFASGFMDSQDGLQYLTVARRIYYDHTIEMPIETYATRDKIHMNIIESADGKEYAVTGLGYSLALLPSVFFEDVFLRFTDNEPISAFPLQSDWPVLLFASMTNAFFGAVFVVSFYYFLRLLKVNHFDALKLSFLTSISSSILIYSKHSFAHMMFVSFMFLSFALIKKHSIKKQKKDMFLAGLAFGIMLISYNASYVFVVLALCLYYLILNINELKKKFLNFFSNFLPFIAGSLPFYLLNNYVIGAIKLSQVSEIDRVSSELHKTIYNIPAYVFVEGFWGILFSPGKSIFLYSPILIILVIFWYKLSFKKFKAEILSGLLLFFTYLFCIGTFTGSSNLLIWHGDSSFGSRYMLAVMPLFLVFISLIYLKLNKKVKLIVFYPILLISLLVQIIGISQPYQIRFAGLQTNVGINGTILSVSEYGNIIPRYSPLLSMSKKFVRKILDLRLTFNKDRNKLKFYDGFGYPFGSSNNYWRSMEEYSLLKVPKDSKIALKVVNHQIVPTSTYSAQINIRNDSEETTQIIEAGEGKIVELNSKSDLLSFNKSFIGAQSTSIPKEQVVFITQAWVNDEYQNLNTIDYPYVSPISKSLLNINYEYWGNKQKDPWSIWHMHSGVYEKTFDFWWLRPFQYWDLPKDFFAILFIFNFSCLIYFGVKVAKYESKKD